MKRYLNSFFITTVIYILLAVGFFYTFANQNLKVKKEDTKKVISLNHLKLDPPKKKMEEPKKEKIKPKKVTPKKVVKKPKKKVVKKPKKKILKKKPIKKKKVVKKPTPKPIKKEVPKPVKEEKRVVEKVEEKPKQKVEKIQKIVKPKEVVTKKQIVKEQQPNEDDLLLRKYLLQIRQAIQRSIKYPRRAKAFNVQGDVVVKFEIQANGDVENIEIIQGHKYLRKATIKAIKKASESFPKPEKSLNIKLPVQFSLK